MPFPRESADYDKASMPQNMLLSDSLEDLANLRKQLYSAAEYFELSYINDDQKQIVANTLKDYAIKALVSTVDHLGSVTYKANDMLDEKVVEVSGTELRISCVEQALDDSLNTRIVGLRWTFKFQLPDCYFPFPPSETKDVSRVY
nr:protein ABIL3-like [Ipomoea batatas]